jgi:hypothetical protein
MSSASSAQFTVHTPESLKKQRDHMQKYLISFHLDKASSYATQKKVMDKIKEMTDIDLGLEMNRVEHIIAERQREQQREPRQQMTKHITEYYSDSDSPEERALLASLGGMSFDDLVKLNHDVVEFEKVEHLMNSFGGKRTLRRKQKVVRKSKKRSGHKRIQKASRRHR